MNRVVTSLEKSSATVLTHTERACLPQGIRRDPVKIFGRIKPELHSTVTAVCDGEDTMGKEGEGCVTFVRESNAIRHGSEYDAIHTDTDILKHDEQQQRSSKHTHCTVETEPEVVSGNHPSNLRRRQQVPRKSVPAVIPIAEPIAVSSPSTFGQANFIAMSYGQQTASSYQSPQAIRIATVSDVGSRVTTQPSQKTQQNGSYSWGDALPAAPPAIDTKNKSSAARTRAQTECTAESGKDPDAQTQLFDPRDKDKNTDHDDDHSDSDDVFQTHEVTRSIVSDGWEEVCVLYSSCVGFISKYYFTRSCR